MSSQAKGYIYINQTTMEIFTLAYYTPELIVAKKGWYCYTSSADWQHLSNDVTDLIAEGFTKVEAISILKQLTTGDTEL